MSRRRAETACLWNMMQTLEKPRRGADALMNFEPEDVEALDMIILEIYFQSDLWCTDGSGSQ